MNRLKSYVLFLVFLASASLILTACDSGSGSNTFASPNGGGSANDDSPTSWAVGPDGAAVSLINLDDPVTISARDLEANSPYSIRITDPDGQLHNPAGGYRVVSDEDGRLTNLTIIQNLSLTLANDASPVSRSGITSRDAGVVPGSGDLGEPPFIDPTDPPPAVVGDAYTVAIVDANGVTQRTIEFGVTSTNRLYCADSSGADKASFASTEDVYARVLASTVADGDYNVLTTSDLNAILEDGAFLSTASAAVMSISGGNGLVNLGTFEQGPYDVIVDLNGNGVFDRNVDLISRYRRHHSCFTVQAVNDGTAMVNQIASDRGGNFRDVFDSNTSEPFVRDVWSFVTPAMQSQIKQTLAVGNYIVGHKNNWTDGDVLTDVSSTIELDPAQSSSIDQAPWPIWVRQELAPGCYDTVIDVNQNGRFDAGVDFVDNIDNQGVASCGFRVADPACATNITLASPSDGTNVDATAIALSGSVANSPVSGFVNIVAGSQASTVNLSIDANGSFSATLPLFNGRNVLTVAFIYADGQACARTITVNSSSAATLNSLLRVQMTWDGDTDMDLHLTRPGGAYFSDADDCYYANCNVGISGTGTNEIDWGEAGEDDDAKLDVDCISCGNGIENIWMNEINEDGDYTIYLDAFSGQETDVTATVFIRNAQVGQVNCGDLQSGTAIDTCRVGTITWEGGAIGTGVFTSDGTKGTAGDF